MGAEHVLRPKSHQRSLSYALNTSKPRDETVAFKFYGRCKQGLLTSPGWSAPWSGWCGRRSGGGGGPRRRGQGRKQSPRRGPHLELLRRFLGADWTQADVHFKGLWFQRTSAGFVPGPAPGLFGNRYIGGAGSVVS